MTSSPAVLPVAVSTPLSVFVRSGAPARQSGGSSDVATQGNAGGNSAKATATAQPGRTEDTPVPADHEKRPPPAFAEIIRQMSSGTPPSNSGEREFVLPLHPAKTPRSLAPPIGPPVLTAPDKKAGLRQVCSVPWDSDRGLANPAHAAKDHSQETTPVPVDVIVPLPAIAAKVAELSPTGGIRNAQLHQQSSPALPPRSEAALNIVIGAGEQTGSPPQLSEAAQQAASASDAYAVEGPGIAQEAGATVPSARTMSPEKAGDAAPGAQTTSVQPAVPTDEESQGPPPTQEVSYSLRQTIGLVSLSTATDRKKSTGNADTDSDTGATQSSVTQTAFQDLQLKTEPAKGADHAMPRSQDPEQTAAPQPAVSPDKARAQPVRSVALEFTPDGARDVKVRLLERAGEVHVSVHSTDPSITKSLRDGVTDLTSVLAHAGYDAKAWTSGRQQQDSQRQPDQQMPQRRGRDGGEAESFDGVLQNPDQEIS